MKAKNANGKIYVAINAYLGHSETFCRGGLVEVDKLRPLPFPSLPPWSGRGEGKRLICSLMDKTTIQSKKCLNGFLE